MSILTHFPSKVFLLLVLKGRFCSSFSSIRYFFTTNSNIHSSSLQSLTFKQSGIIKQKRYRIGQNTNIIMKQTKITTTATEDDNNDINPKKDQQKHEDQQLIFGKFKISPSQIFYTSPTKLSAAIVNLRPIVPGHVLIIPKRIVPKVSQLDTDEYIDLWQTVRLVQSMLEKHYNAQGFNIAIQDGKVAGQSVAHVHVHILPRVVNDFERNDDIYDELELWAPTVTLVKMKQDEKEINGNGLHVPDDNDRKDRTMQDMEDEAVIYRNLLVAL